MIRAIRPAAMAQDDAAMVAGWNIAPNVSYTLQLNAGPYSCGVLLYSEDMTAIIASGAGLVGTDQPVILHPYAGQSIGMVDADLGWHLLLTTDGTESPRTIKIGPAVDLPDEIHPIYADDDLAVVRATAGVDDHAHYIDDVSVACPRGFGAWIGDVASVPVDMAAVDGQAESITWTGTPNGTSDQVVVRRHVAIAPEPHVDPVPITPPSVEDDTAETDAATEATGNVLANDGDGLTIVAVNGLTASVGVAVAGSEGGVFVIDDDGSWTFDPDGDFAALEGSETSETSVTYHASDGVSEASATLTVTVSAVSIPVPTDPHWSNVVLCINPAGEDGSTVIIDATGKTLTRIGEAQIDTSLGFPTILFDGDVDGLIVGANDGFNFGSGNFTIEFWVRFLSFNANSSRLWNPNGDVVDGIDITMAGSGYLSIAMSSNGSSFNLLNANSFLRLAINTNYYVRVARDGGAMKCGVNGTVYTLTTGLGTAALYYAGRSQSVAGQYPGVNRSLNGHIRGYRVTKGVAHDVAIVPELPYPTA